jgi:hypothetical protein
MSITLFIHQGDSLSIQYWSELYWERKSGILLYSMIRKVRTVLYLHYIYVYVCTYYRYDTISSKENYIW